MLKHIIITVSFVIYFGSIVIAQTATNQEESIAWKASVKDLNDREKQINATYASVDEVAKDKLEIELKAIAAKKLERKATYIVAHPNSAFSLGLINDELLFLANYEDGSKLYSKLGDEIIKTPAAKKIGDRLAILKRSAIGEQLLDFTQNDNNGVPVKSSDLKGKYVLVDFWASWCKPCRAENPNVLKAYNQYKEKGFTVLGISLDDKAESWKKAIQDDHMPWVQVSDLKGFKNEVSTYYGINAIPSTLLIDPQGRIIAKDLRGNELGRRLEEIFSTVEKDKAQNDALNKMKRPERLKWIEEYVSKNPTSKSGPYFLNEFLKFDWELTMEQQEVIMNKFNGAAKLSPDYISMANVLERKKKLLPGNMAPDFTLLKPDGKPLTLSSTRGKYVLIDFWASWCVPCRKAIPHLKEVYEKYRNKGFEIIALSADQSDASWRKAMEQEKMPWLQVCDDFPSKFEPARVGSIYQTKFIPFYVLIDKRGEILVYSGNKEEVDRKLAEIFKD